MKSTDMSPLGMNAEVLLKINEASKDRGYAPAVYLTSSVITLLFKYLTADCLKVAFLDSSNGSIEESQPVFIESDLRNGEVCYDDIVRHVHNTINGKQIDIENLSVVNDQRAFRALVICSNSESGGFLSEEFHTISKKINYDNSQFLFLFFQKENHVEFSFSVPELYKNLTHDHVLAHIELLVPNLLADTKLPIKDIDYVSPIELTQTSLEDKIRAIWIQNLKVDKIEDQDTFADLGGYSYLVFAIQHQMQKELGLKPKFKDFFSKNFSAFVEIYQDQMMDSSAQVDLKQ